VVVMHDSVLVKKVQKHENKELLSLISINPEYPPITINTHQIQEIWEVSSKISSEFDESAGNMALSQIQQSLTELKKEINLLKN